jgi:hypothetical protein
MAIWEHMGMMRFAFAFLLLAGLAPAALKPVDADLQPVDRKAVATYKTTPQGDLKMYL